MRYLFKLQASWCPAYSALTNQHTVHLSAAWTLCTVNTVLLVWGNSNSPPPEKRGGERKNRGGYAWDGGGRGDRPVRYLPGHGKMIFLLISLLLHLSCHCCQCIQVYWSPHTREVAHRSVKEAMTTELLHTLVRWFSWDAVARAHRWLILKVEPPTGSFYRNYKKSFPIIWWLSGVIVNIIQSGVLDKMSSRPSVLSLTFWDPVRHFPSQRLANIAGHSCFPCQTFYTYWTLPEKN